MMLSYSVLLLDRQALSEHTTTSSFTESLGQALRVSLVKPGAYLSESYRLKPTIRLDTERISRREDEAGCFVLLTNVPTAGDLAHSARDILTVYKEQHGTEQNYGFLKDPVIVNSLFLKKPERIEALGLVLLLAFLL